MLSGLGFSGVCLRGEREREIDREREREREREGERVDRTSSGVNFVFCGFLNDPRRGQERLKVQVRGELGAAKCIVAYRPASSVLTGFSLRLFLARSDEGPHEKRRIASRKEQLFALFFIA